MHAYCQCGTCKKCHHVLLRITWDTLFCYPATVSMLRWNRGKLFPPRGIVVPPRPKQECTCGTCKKCRHRLAVTLWHALEKDSRVVCLLSDKKMHQIIHNPPEVEMEFPNFMREVQSRSRLVYKKPSDKRGNS